MSFKYTYDITDFLNNKVAGGSLTLEIQASNIVKALSHINSNSTKCDIYFKAELSSSEEDILDALVAAHIGEPPADQDFLKDSSGKLIVHNTVRKQGLKFVWSGEGDDPTDPYSVWGGQELFYYHGLGDDSDHFCYIDLNTIANETYMQEGMVFWSGAKGDSLCADIVPRTATVVSGTNTYFNLYGGYLVIPAAGDGTINVTSDLTTHSGGLVYIPKDEFGVRPQAFWNADWNSTTKEYENITAAPYGDGAFNIFAGEIVLQTFIHELHMLGENEFPIHSQDADQIGHGMRIRIHHKTNTVSGIGDHEWMVSCIMTLHREYTTAGYDTDHEH